MILAYIALLSSLASGARNSVEQDDFGVYYPRGHNRIGEYRVLDVGTANLAENWRQTNNYIEQTLNTAARRYTEVATSGCQANCRQSQGSIMGTALMGDGVFGLFESGEAQVSIRSNDNDALGIIWAQDRDNFYLFQYVEEESACSIVKVKGGTKSNIAGYLRQNCPSGLRRGSFDQVRFRLDRISSTQVRLQGRLRGNLVLNLLDTSAIEGAFVPGMYNSWHFGPRYDNFRVWETGASCSNGVLDGDERFIDCGGPCSPCNSTTTMQLDFTSAKDIRGWSSTDRTTNGGVANWHINSGQLRQNGNVGGSNYGTSSSSVTARCRARGFSTVAVYEGWGRNFYPDFDYEARMYNGDDDRIMMVFNYVDLNNFYWLELQQQSRCVVIRKRRRGGTADLADLAASASQTYALRTWHVWKIESRYDYDRDRRTIKVFRDGVEVLEGTDSQPLGPGAFGFATDWNSDLRIDWARFTTYKPSTELQCASSELPVTRDLTLHLDAAGNLVRNTQLIDQTADRRNTNFFGGPSIRRNSWRNSLDSFFMDDSNDHGQIWKDLMVTPRWQGLTATIVVQPSDGRDACYLCQGFVTDTRIGWGIRSESGVVRAGAITMFGGGRQGGLHRLSGSDFTQPSIYTIRLTPSSSSPYGNFNSLSWDLSAYRNGQSMTISGLAGNGGSLNRFAEGFLKDRLRIGHASWGSNRLRGHFFETAVYPRPLSDGEIEATHLYLRDRYGVGSCEDLSPPTNAAYINGTCSSAGNGDVCRHECSSGFVRVTGDYQRRCDGGGFWSGAALVCEPACEWDPAPDTPADDDFALRGGCRRDLFALDFATDASRTGRTLQESSTTGFRGLVAYPVFQAFRWGVTASMDDALVFNADGANDCGDARQHSVALVGSSPWQNSRDGLIVNARVMIPAGELAGVVTRAGDGGQGYYIFAVSADMGTAAIYTVTNGVWSNQTLCSSADPVPSSAGGAGGVGEASLTGLSANSWVMLSLEVTEDGMLMGSFNDRVVCTAKDSRYRFGSAGMWVSGAVPAAAFRDFSVSRVDPNCGGTKDRVCYDLTEGRSCWLQCDAGYYSTGSTKRTCERTGASSIAFNGTSIGCMLKAPEFPAGVIELDAPENLQRGDAVGSTLNATVDEGSGLTIIYEILAGNDLGIFEIDGCSGQLLLVEEALDFENPQRNYFTLLINAYIVGSPQQANSTKTVYVNVLDSNDPPIAGDAQMTVPENSVANTLVGRLVAQDPEDDELTYSMQFGDSRRFKIDPDGSVRVIEDALALDFESPENSFNILYRAEDSDDPTVYGEGFLTILITNVNEPPVLVSDDTYIVDETLYDFNITLGDDVRVADPDAGDSATFTVGSGGSASGLFSVDASGRVFAASSASAERFIDILAFEQDGRQIKAKDTLTITARDQGGRTAVQELTLYVTANITTADPIISGVVLDDGTGGATGGGEGEEEVGGLFDDFRLDTTGGQVVFFYGSNILVKEADPWAVVTARALDGAGVSSGLEYTVECRFQGVNESQLYGIEDSGPPDGEDTSSGGGGDSGGLGGEGNSTEPIEPVGRVIDQNVPYIACLTPAGAGTGWRWNLWIRFSPTTVRNASSNIPLIHTYEAPSPISVADENAQRVMNTIGDDTFFLSGQNFGPPVYATIAGAVRVTYGPVGGENKYVAQVVSVDQDVIEVRTAPGSGGWHSWMVEVAGQSGVIQGAPEDDGTRYLSPNPTDLTLFIASAENGPDELLTRGGQTVVVDGDQFGPAGSPLDVQFRLRSSSVEWANQTFDRLITLQFTSCQHNPLNPHTQLICTTPAGSGSGFSLWVSVDGQADVLSQPQSGLPFGYAKPIVTAVGGAGAVDANTEGGQVIRIDGVSFGPAQLPPASQYPTPVRVYYGGADADEYEAVGCRMVAAGTSGAALLETHITCETAPGTGRGHALVVEVSGQRSEVPYLRPTEGITYGPPVLASFQASPSAPTGSDVVGAADTAGSEEIMINGRNFGRWTDRLMVAYYKEIETPLNDDGSSGAGELAGGPNEDVIRFEPAVGSCVVLVPDRQIRCTTGAGAGASLNWIITVDGQNSSNPVTAYAAPVLTSVHAQGQLSTSIPPPGLSTDGGERLSIVGMHFGPSGDDFNGDTGLVQRVAYGIGGVALSGITGKQPGNASSSSQPQSGTVYEPIDYEVVSHTRVDVVLPPSIGEGHCFGMLVADQETVADPTSSPARYCFDFAPPQVTSLTPRRSGSNPDGATMTIRGTNLGLRDPTADVLVIMGVGEAGPGVSVLAPSARTPSIDQVQAAVSTGSPTWYNNLPAAAAQSITVPIPAGVGKDIPVRVMTYTPPSQSTGRRSQDVALSRFSYDAPVVDFVLLRRVDPSDPQEVFAARRALGNSVVDGAPTGPNGTTSASNSVLDQLRIVEVIGQNFGPSMLGSAVETTEVGGAGITVTTDAAAELPLFVAVARNMTTDQPFWRHDRIELITSVSQGNLRVVTRPTRSTPAVNWQASNTAEYRQESPRVFGLVGKQDGFLTQGGEILHVRIGNLQAAETLRIEVGLQGGICPITDSNGNARTPAQVATDIQSQTDNAPDANNVLFDIYCRLPEGQGTDNPLVVYRGETPGQSDSIRVAYAAPTITSISMRATSSDGWTVVSSGANLDSSPVRIPSRGGQIRIRGENLGIAPQLVHGRNGAEASWVLLGNMTSIRQSGGATAISRSHTEIVIGLGEGVGNGVAETGSADGYVLDIMVGDQPTAVSPRVWYRIPSVSSFQAADRPTLGGNLVIIDGNDFGTLLESEVPVVRIGGRVCTNTARVASHSRLSCDAPAGTGLELDIEVEIGGQIGTGARLYSYNPPTISAAVVSETPSFQGPRPEGSFDFGGPSLGGFNITLTGTDFGDPSIAGAAGTERGLCVFLPALSDAQLACDGRLNNPWEGEVWSGHIRVHSHGRLVVEMPPGMGNRRFVLYIGGHTVTMQASTLGNNNVGEPRAMEAADGAALMSYDAPVVTAMTPQTGSTAGRVEVTLTGYGFGWGSTVAANGERNTSEVLPSRRLQGFSPYGNGGAPLPLPSVPLTADPEESALAKDFPPPYMVRVDFAQGCVSSAVTPISAQIPGNIGELSSCEREQDGFGVVGHGDLELKFMSLPGIGVEKEVRIVVIGPDGTIVSRSNPVRWSFDPPVITDIRPNILRMKRHPWLDDDTATIVPPPGVDPELAAEDAEDLRTRSSILTIVGRNFGPLDTRGWTDQERVLQVWVDGRPCRNPIRSLDTRGSLLDNAGTPEEQQIVTCSLEWLEVGYKPINITVAGQTSAATPGFAFETVCAAGYYGQPGEHCISCPLGAQCDGYNDGFIGFTNFTVPLMYQDGQPNPELAAQRTGCLACQSEPRSIPGYFNLLGLEDPDGRSESFCNDARVPTRDPPNCNTMAPCEPPEACLGNNECAVGYSAERWPFRCSQCAEGYYKRSGLCVECPDNPEVFIVLFIIAAMVGAFAAFALNRAQVNIAFISIGTDYFQVVATLASSRVRWPEMLEELFHVLSAFNLNIELTAPECIVPDVDFVEKWTAFVLLIPAIFMMLLAVNYGYSAYKVFCRGSDKHKAFSHTGQLVQMSLLLLYFSFYPMVRIVFDALNCSASGNPVERDRNGDPIMYLQAVHEPCDLKGGVHQTLLPWAIVAMIAYAVIYPGFMAYAHYYNRRLFMIDQLLRAMGRGETREENRLAFDVRKMYSRTYYQLRPDYVHWIFVLLARKFVLAITSLLYVRTPSLQMASALLVVFFAYTMQVIYNPFMSPARFPNELKEHERLAKEGHPVHQKLRDDIRGMMRHWRKSGHSNTMVAGAPKELTLERAGEMLVQGAFDYNTLEATLLACALLVMLSGVMFEALAEEDSRETEREGLAILVVVIIASSIIYFFFVVCAEVYNIISVRNAKEAALEGKKDAFKKRPSVSSGIGDAPKIRDAAGEYADVPQVNANDQQMNPMFLKMQKKKKKDGEGGESIDPEAGGVDDGTVRAMLEAPDQGVWMVLREQYLAMSDQVKELRVRVRDAEMDAAAGAADPSSSTRMAAAATQGRRKVRMGGRRRAFGQQAAGTGRESGAVSTTGTGARERSPSIASGGSGGSGGMTLNAMRAGMKGRRGSGRKLLDGGGDGK